MAREVIPFAPDAWVGGDDARVGYEIPLTRLFYRVEVSRPLEEIDADIRRLESEIQGLMREIAR